MTMCKAASRAAAASAAKYVLIIVCLHHACLVASNDAEDEIHIPDHSHDVEHGLDGMVTPLMQHRAHITVHVRLAGFSQDGNLNLWLTEHDLTSYLHSLPPVVNSSILSLRESLAVSAQIMYHVSKTSPRVADELQKAVSTAVAAAEVPTGRNPNTTPRVISHSIVDAIIAIDMQHTADDHYTIYILNPKAPAHPYVYDYGVRGSCVGTLWASQRPYAWVDLTAGPAHYGPGPGRRGQVLDHSLPSLRHLTATYLKFAALPELAAATYSAVQHLVWPPLQHVKLPDTSRVQVHVIYLHKSLLGVRSSVSVNALLEKLSQLQMQQGQTFAVDEHFLPLSACDVCSMALARSLKTRSVRSRGAVVRMETHEYLDSIDLYTWLRRSIEEIFADVNIYSQPVGGPTQIPVFVVEQGMPGAPLLLDAEHQAVAFPGMVVAVHSPSSHMETDFMCDGRVVEVDESMLTRAVLAATLQAVFGVADTSLAVGVDFVEQENYLWSVGNTPFSPLSRVEGLSFSQIDAAKRNIVLLSLNQTIRKAEKHLVALHKLAGDRKIKEVISKQDYKQLGSHLNTLHLHLEAAAHALAKRDHPKAFRIAELASHAVGNLSEITSDIHFDLSQHFECPHDPLFTGWWIGAVAASLLAMIMFALKSRQEAAVRSKWY